MGNLVEEHQIPGRAAGPADSDVSALRYADGIRMSKRRGRFRVVVDPDVPE